jgi:hypothetical protein
LRACEEVRGERVRRSKKKPFFPHRVCWRRRFAIGASVNLTPANVMSIAGRSSGFGVVLRALTFPLLFFLYEHLYEQWRASGATNKAFVAPEESASSSVTAAQPRGIWNRCCGLDSAPVFPIIAAFSPLGEGGAPCNVRLWNRQITINF